MSTPMNMQPRLRNVFDDTIETAAQRADMSTAAMDRIRARKTAPRKYLDADRTQVSLAYRIWKQGRRFNADEVSQSQLLRSGDGPANHAVYYPEAYDKDLGDGSWIFVIDPPHTEQSARFQVPLLSLWWARPHVLNAGRFGSRLPYQAVIQTPAGDLHLWPHEYALCRDPEVLLGEDGVQIHALGGEPLLDEDQLFYLRSRGISGTDAVQLLFSQINQPNYCYVTMPREAVGMYVGVGTRAGSTVVSDYNEGRVR